ncbi:MAG TPA: ABC transporter permease subunit [Bacillota bacterium]|jgi:ABC-type transport system involved in multi-copper enzyme maturation permease subunit
MILNPILAKEYRSRMRTWRAPGVITLYVLLLGLVGYAYFRLLSSQILNGGYLNPQVGMQIFYVLAIFQLLLVAFVTPSLTAGLISGERERQTLDLLLCTRLSATSIILGKLTAAVSFVLLLIVASVPVYSVVFLFGGVSPRELLMTLLIFVITGLAYATIGLFCSTLLRRTQAATILAYALVFTLVFGTYVLGGIQMAMGSMKARVGPYYGPTMPWFMNFNPLQALMSAMPTTGGFYIPYFPIPVLSSSWGPGRPTTPAWQPYLIFSAITIVALTMASVYFIKPVRSLRPRGVSFPTFGGRRGRGRTSAVGDGSD